MVKRKQQTTGVSESGAPFTLEQIRQMKIQGSLSQQEYENLRNKIIQYMDMAPGCGMVAESENEIGRHNKKGPRKGNKGDSWRDNGISE
ncbi:MAG: hypothetical protein JXD22_08040 [Sedimentisphaerales bacterium]|nr:hypothetical protein [Sedimentisphaerales bacterium]